MVLLGHCVSDKWTVQKNTGVENTYVIQFKTILEDLYFALVLVKLNAFSQLHSQQKKNTFYSLHFHFESRVEQG